MQVGLFVMEAWPMFMLLNVSYMFPVFNTTSLFWITFFTNDNTKINESKVNLPEYIGYLEKKKKAKKKHTHGNWS